MRRLLYYSLFSLLWISVNSCNDDEVGAPPKPSFTVDKTSGLYNSTEFTFTVDQVGSSAVSLLPYGEEFPSKGGILIPASSFTNGKATVKFTYGDIGTFNAVAVANNHSKDGKSVKNTLSDTKAITITSDVASISDFNISGSTKAEFKNKVDSDIDSFVVQMPYGADVAKLKPTYTKSDFSKVTVGGTEQSSGSTENNFSSPVTYTVTSQNGAVSTSYLVIVNVTPVETTKNFKSVAGNVLGKKSNGKALPSDINNEDRVIVIYDTLGTSSDEFDSIAFDYALSGSFAYAKYAGKKMAAKTRLNLTSEKQVEVTAQDSSKVTYDVYAAAAPKLTLMFPLLSPSIKGVTSDFTVKLSVLNGTTVSSINTTKTVETADGVTVSSIRVTPLSTITDEDPDGVSSLFVDGTAVDYSKGAKFELTVVDTNIGVTYKVVYTATVTVLK
jgi:hypothetical protein